MAVPQTKAELLDAIHSNYQKLVTDLSRVPLERTQEMTLAGHATNTQLSVVNLVAYLIGWNLLVLKWCDAKARR